MNNSIFKTESMHGQILVEEPIFVQQHPATAASIVILTPMVYYLSSFKYYNSILWHYVY